MSLLSELWWGCLRHGWVVVWYMCVWHSSAGNQICLRNVWDTDPVKMTDWPAAAWEFSLHILREYFCAQSCARKVFPNFYLALETGKTHRFLWRRARTRTRTHTTHHTHHTHRVSTLIQLHVLTKNCSVHGRVSTWAMSATCQSCEVHIKIAGARVRQPVISS